LDRLFFYLGTIVPSMDVSGIICFLFNIFWKIVKNRVDGKLLSWNPFLFCFRRTYICMLQGISNLATWVFRGVSWNGFCFSVPLLIILSVDLLPFGKLDLLFAIVCY
jgi:hypothetical protein